MGDPRRVAAAPEKPLLIFDGDCGFCRRWILRWKSWTAGRVDYAPSQEAAARFPEIPAEAFHDSVVLVTPDGDWFEAAEAVFRSLAFAPGGGWMLALYRSVPGFAPVTELGYRLIARHRTAASAATTLLWGKSVEAPTYALANGLFVRLVGLCFLAAFLSLWIQVDGLIGSRGILPAGEFLESVRSQLGGARWTLFPTLAWISSSDGFLHLLCAGGTLASALVLAGFVPAPAIFVSWLFYLSLSVVGQDFLEFQWDLLLLETGFLAIFLAPWRAARFGRFLPGSRVARALLLWLLFRLMFSSGLVKLASGDPNWRNLTALTYHYWSQPLPPWTAWFMDKLPLSFQKASCLFMFAVELAAPFFILAPRRLRLIAAAAMVSLEALIALTGNYAFFNLLTIALCVLLVDDASFPRRFRPAGPAGERSPRRGWPRWLLWPAAAVLFLLSCVHFVSGTLRWRMPWPGFAISIVRAAIPFRSVGSYGLFMVMTTTRPEIAVEGSADGETWKAYEFRWKPGDAKRRPAFVAPHQPRLDWQMWFAALGRCEDNPWFYSFQRRLLEGSPPVLRLLGHNPFPDSPPRYLRTTTYSYRFTDFATRRQTGAWWRRDPLGPYCPPLQVEQARP
ncbi:MAG TPA: lipase maturation factor family protein [Thermoanaerobaculia bacterium]|nr:lipase maturation factor family protein [Thermoanaerobaculia bacterium]